MWRQFELVAIIGTSFAKERSVDGKDKSCKAGLLSTCNQLSSHVTVTVNVELKEMQT